MARLKKCTGKRNIAVVNEKFKLLGGSKVGNGCLKCTPVNISLGKFS
jgi:hypothetical protein